MEEGPDLKGKKAHQPFSWLPQIDQVLVVGMKYGPKGTHEAVKKLQQIAPEPVSYTHLLGCQKGGIRHSA